MTANLNALSFVLLVLAGVSYVRHRGAVLTAAAALFFPVTAASTVLTWWGFSPALGLAILLLTLGISLVCLALFGIDVVWAPFCLEMTYLTVLCWVLCSAVVLLNYIGMGVFALLTSA